MSLTPPIWVLLVLGAVAVRRREAALILAWLVVSLAPLWLKIGPAIFTLLPRYLSFLFPGLVVLAALGADWVASRLSTWKLPRVAVSGFLGLGILIWSVPGVVSFYNLPKEEYRQAAAALAGGSIVIGMGGCNAFVPRSLNYYFQLYDSLSIAFDEADLDDRAIAAIKSRPGPVYAANFDPCSPHNVLPPIGADLVAEHFRGFTLIRTRDLTLAPIDQARVLLQWGAPLDPNLRAFLGLFGQPAGDNLLNADDWQFDSATLLQDSGFVVHPGGLEKNVILSLGRPSATDLALFFRFRNGELQGEQRVFVSAHDAAGNWLSVFPSGAGYLCPSARDWKSGAFAFSVPADTTRLTIWLRARGQGVAEFRDIELKELH